MMSPAFSLRTSHHVFFDDAICWAFLYSSSLIPLCSMARPIDFCLFS